MSPCVATTRPSLTATFTPQPVPQKRHGAFDHFIRVNAASVTTFCAAPGSGIPATEAAAAAADCLTKVRRVIFKVDLVVHGGGALAVLVDERGGEHPVERLQADERVGDRGLIRRFQRHHELA